MLYSTQVTQHERGWTRKQWDKYGLSTKTPGPIKDFVYHNLVANWLDNHSDDREKYLKKEIGFRYYDVLKKAENK